MSVTWDAQYGNQFFELEYGPAGFAEGTGTLVGPITPDSDYACRVELDSLENATAYTVRVRAWCEVTQGYSDWTGKDFVSETWYNVSAIVNNEEWGTVAGTGDYREGSVAELWAWSYGEHFPFVMWGDSLGSRIRYVTVTQDTVFTAIFACDTCSSAVDVPDRLVFSVTPNPAIDHLTVSTPSDEAYSLAVYDDKGLRQMLLDFTGTSCVLDISALPKGHYILRLSDNSKSGVRGFVKQ